MFKLAALITLATLAAAQHHHLGGGFFPGGNYEHPEQGGVSFFYDPTSHYLVSSTHSTCYFMDLDTAQQTSVHTGAGMEKLELQMMAMMSGSETALTSDQLAKYNHIISRMCHSHKLYMIGAPMVDPSVVSPEH